MMQGTINPYIAGSPVRERSMFFGRESVFEMINESLVHSDPARIVVLHGQRRVGKTSILYQMVYHLPDDYVPLLIDLQGMSLDGLSGLLWEMAQVIRRGLRRMAGVVVPRENRAAFFADPENGIRTFFDTVQQAVGNRHLVLMFDETTLIADKIGAGELEEQIFTSFSELMQRYPFLDFCFSLGSKHLLMYDKLTTMSRQAVYREIGFLRASAARALITRPVWGILEYEPQAVDRILRLTSGQPYYTQLVCHELFSYVQNRGKRTIRSADVDAIRMRVVEMATSQLHYVWEETSLQGQRVLLALAEMEKRDDPATSIEQICQVLAERNIPASPDQVGECLQQLSARYIIGTDRPYSFRVDLFRYWILQNQRLEWT